MFHSIHVRPFEYGLVFRDRAFVDLLEPGQHRRLDPFGRLKIEIVSQREPWLEHEQLDLIVKSGALTSKAEVIDLADHERALVWIDGRFHAILSPGRYVYWTGFRKVRTEIVDARNVCFEHAELETIAAQASSYTSLNVQDVAPDYAGVLFVGGRYMEALQPGRYAFWKNRVAVSLVPVSKREQVIDVPGQDVLTSDRVTLRLTAVVAFRVTDPFRYVTATDDVRQALYREAQLIVRKAVGGRTLDVLLADKEALTVELSDALRAKAGTFGVELVTVGVKDIVLPGEMRDLLNKVIEARTVAEAAVITRREESAALRHQANAAKLLTETPGLMKLRELEAVERIAAGGKLNIVLGDKGLAERLTTLV